MTLTRCALTAVIAVGLAVPAVAQDDAKKAADKLDQLSKDLQALKDSLKVEDMRAKLVSIESKIDLLDREIQDIKKDVQEFRRRAGEGPTTALRPEFDAATAKTQGRVRVINTHPYELSIVLNGMAQAHRLLPGEERLFVLPAGPYRVEILQFPGVGRSGEVVAGQTKTLTIYPIQ